MGSALLIAAAAYLYVGFAVTVTGLVKNAEPKNAPIAFSGWVGIFLAPILWALVVPFVIAKLVRERKDA